MVDEITSSNIIVRADYDAQLLDFENALLLILQAEDLPTQGVFTNVSERSAVFRNLKNVLMKIDTKKRQQSLYLSKFVVAVSGGLFDAALNYLWDETIAELRYRVAQYDLSYFYDNVVSNAEKRNLKDASGLTKIDDSELIRGARSIGLITDIGYSRLENIRCMRNWASAAHPNQVELTGLDLVNWLEACMIHVISTPLSEITVHIGQLLHKIKTSSIDKPTAEAIGLYFDEPPNRGQVNNLIAGLFGIYTRTDAPPQTRQNIHLLLPPLWPLVDEATRYDIGLKYGKFVVSSDQKEEEKLALQFLEAASALAYQPENLRYVEIKTAIENLLHAHRNFGNFYNEPPFARELQRLVGEVGRVPSRINQLYVLGLVEVFLTNGHGEVWNAEHIYRSLINLFDSVQAFIAVRSIMVETIASWLEFDRCQQKYRELLEMMKTKVSEEAVKELIDNIEAYKGPFSRLKDDTRFKQKVTNLMKIKR